MNSNLKSMLRAVLAFFLFTSFLVHMVFKYSTEYNKYDQVETMKHLFQRARYDVDCKKIISMDSNEQAKAKSLVDKLREENKLKTLDDTNFIFDKSKCDVFKRARGGTYLLKNSTSNDTIRLAFSILVYEQVEQLERLLHAVYRPQNYYCIHVDKKSSPALHQAVKSITDCFDNMFIASKLETVVYAGYSRLQADINCMEDLNKLPGWSYFMNLASTEFPLRTQHEINTILRMYNGANDVEPNAAFPERVQWKWITSDSGQLSRTNEPLPPSPHGFVFRNGFAYVLLSRAMFDYALNHQYARDLLNYLRDTYSPDESYWATLVFNTKINDTSGYIRCEAETTRIRLVTWQGHGPCHGLWRNGVCVLSSKDLPYVAEKDHFIVNKLLLNFDPVAYQCLEEWYEERRIAQEELGHKFMNNLYRYCEFIKARSRYPNC